MLSSNVGDAVLEQWSDKTFYHAAVRTTRVRMSPMIQIHVRTKLEQRQATLKVGIVHVFFVEPLWPTICMRFCPGTRIVVDSNLLQ